MKLTLLASALAIAAAVNPLQAGGLPVVEDDFVAEARPSSEGRWVVPVIVGIGIIAYLASKGGSSDVCNGDEPAPTPEPC